MRAVIQRVTYAKVEVEGKVSGEIGPGVLVLLGVTKTDTPADAEFLAAKAVHLRIFNDEAGKMKGKAQQAAGKVQENYGKSKDELRAAQKKGEERREHNDRDRERFDEDL